MPRLLCVVDPQTGEMIPVSWDADIDSLLKQNQNLVIWDSDSQSVEEVEKPS